MNENVDFLICPVFQLYGDISAGEPYGSGHINDTFRIRMLQAGTEVSHILQRLNGRVFPEPFVRS